MNGDTQDGLNNSDNRPHNHEDHDPDKETSCLLEEMAHPFSLVIFGATGDLAHRKLFPALLGLLLSKLLPDNFFVIGCGRTILDDASFRAEIHNNLDVPESTSQDIINEFIARFHYQVMDYTGESSYQALKERLHTLENQYNTEGNKLFYLALPPSLYPVVATWIGRCGLSSKSNEQTGWSRLIIEKPFGHDLISAQKLDHTLQKHFLEHQIFRIDHYLAKDTVQNILLFRFANAIFEPIWNRQFIDHIRINAFESIGIEHRSSYYEHAGVIRDMFQNHMMQLLSLTAMEPPARFETEKVRDEKAKVFSSLRPFNEAQLHEHILLGQYGPGVVNGKQAVGYRQESGVSPDSLTPTFASMTVFIDNWRWHDVPFYISSGKRMAEKRTEIIIQFREVPHSMLREVLGKHITANKLTITIAPEESILLSFQTKSPGADLCLSSVNMDFHYKDAFSQLPVDGYGKVLLECIQGDQLLFWRKDSIEKSWSFLTPILSCWEHCDNRQEMIQFYPAGSQRVRWPDTT